MKTINEIKIETLQNELAKATESLERYHCQLEKLVKDFVHYESSKKQRDEELIEMANEMETLKNKIPDFSQETYEAYMQYHDAKEQYERKSKFYGEIDQSTANRKEEISLWEGSINDMEKRIQNIKAELTKSKVENSTTKSNKE